MTYKNEFIGQVKEYFQDSVVAAGAINDAWEDIEKYFAELGSSLEEEINFNASGGDEFKGDSVDSWIKELDMI